MLSIFDDIKIAILIKWTTRLQTKGRSKRTAFQTKLISLNPHSTRQLSKIGNERARKNSVNAFLNICYLRLFMKEKL